MAFLGAPSSLHTALALRQAIWRKANPSWPIQGIPDVLYVDHGSDFTSDHLGQVAAALRIELIHSTVARPQGRGKVDGYNSSNRLFTQIERIMEINELTVITDEVVEAARSTLVIGVS